MRVKELQLRDLMQSFLDENYLTLKELAESCDTEESQILTLEKAQCIPGHTYEKRDITLFTCAGIDTPFSEYSSVETTLYYHSSTIRWVSEALELFGKIDLETLAKKIKVDFLKSVETLLNGEKTPGCESLEQAWRYWIDGTWGKCLKNISAEYLAKKELARNRIAATIEYSSLDITIEQKTAVSEAIKDYIDASMDFDPYSARYQVALQPIEKFKLNIDFEKKYLPQ